MSTKGSLPLTILIPVRNEEDVILPAIESIQKRVAAKYTICIIDDSIDPLDRTIERVERAQRKYKNLSVLKKKPGDSDGFASAIWRGAKEVNGGALVFVMGDLCDKPETIDVMYEKIRSGFDVVVGSRYMRGARKVGGPKLQGFFSFIVNKSLAILLGLPTQDASNSFKMYRRVVFDSLPKPKTVGFEVSMEVFFRAYFQGFRVAEVPTVWFGRTKGKSKFRMIARAPEYIRLYAWALLQGLRSFGE